MNEWYESQNHHSTNLRKFLHERIETANPLRKVTSEEAKRLAKLEDIATRLKRGENVQKSL
jgi:hypothetical protein